MKIQVDAQVLRATVDRARKACPKKPVLPITACLLLATSEAGLVVEGNRLEVAVRATCPCTMIEPGCLAVPADLLAGLVAKLPAGLVELEQHEQTLQVRSGGGNWAVEALAAVEFPTFPSLDRPLGGLAVPVAWLAQAAERVSSTVDPDSPRAALRAVQIETGGGQIRLVSTNQHAMSVSQLPVEHAPGLQGKSLLVPPEFFLPASKAEGVALLTLGEDGAGLAVGTTLSGCRGVADQFPDWCRVLPKDEQLGLSFESAALLAALERVMLFSADKNSPHLICLDCTNRGIAIRSRTAGVGLGDESVSAEAVTPGPPVAIYFNGLYLRQALQVCGGSVALSLRSEHEVALLTAEDGYRHLVMPVRPPAGNLV